jgi:hypothetical protein
MLVLWQTVRDLIVITLLCYEDVHLQVGGCGRLNAPIAMPIQSRAGGSKNKEDPHVEQNPRRTFADEWYQVKFS